MIEFNGVYKSIGHNKIIKNVSFKVEDNDFIILEGANGSGKTSIINLILGIYKLNKKDKGEIIDTFKDVSYFPSLFNLPSLINSYHFLYTYFNGFLDRSVINCYIEKYKIENKSVFELSKGNIQKIILVKCLLENSDLYIFDEPLNGLDSDSKEEFIKDLLQLKNKNKAIIIATHDKEEFKGLYNKNILINNGEII